MNTDRFWNIIESARSSAAISGVPFDEALVELLAGHPPQEILEYVERFDEVHDALYRWDVWAAAYLIGGGCSDDHSLSTTKGFGHGRGRTVPSLAGADTRSRRIRRRTPRGRPHRPHARFLRWANVRLP
ncbi:DUF4240 domain-containing protein [Streptomyces sp. NPDC007929]